MRVTLSFDVAPGMLADLLRKQESATTLLICSSRAAFISTLQNVLPRDEILLNTNLQQVAASTSMGIAFVPTITHLRAYLATFPSHAAKDHLQSEARQLTMTKTPLLFVYGLIQLHRYSSEWSAQGLSITLSSLVEACSISGYKVTICEDEISPRLEMEETLGTRALDGEGGVEKLGQLHEAIEEMSGKGMNEWDEQLPMQSGSTRRLAISNDGTEWAGRTVPIGRVLQRWCKCDVGA